MIDYIRHTLKQRTYLSSKTSFEYGTSTKIYENQAASVKQLKNTIEGWRKYRGSSKKEKDKRIIVKDIHIFCLVQRCMSTGHKNNRLS